MPDSIATLYSKPFPQSFEPRNYRQFGGSWGNLKERHGLVIGKKSKTPSTTTTTTPAVPSAATPTPIEVPPQKRLRDEDKEKISKAVTKAVAKQKGGHKRNRIDELLGDDSY